MPLHPQLVHLFQDMTLPRSGVVLVNKPVGVTSHDVVAVCRRLTGIKRIGHAGTLDPLASGLLIILIGREYTKQQASFLHLPKVYQVRARLGWVSQTYDAEGPVTEMAPWESYAHWTQTDLQQVATTFLGIQQQTVPGYSAVKKDGRKLYELARQGTLDPTNLPSKEVEVTNFTITDRAIDPDVPSVEFSARIACSSGTYIRSLIHDLGQKLGCGAYVTALHRVSIGLYKVPDSVAVLPLAFTKQK